MKKIIWAILIACISSAVIFACKKIDNGTTQSCINKTLLIRQWNNTYIRTDNLNTSGVVTSSSIEATPGYFSLNSSLAYTVVSGSTTRYGIWKVDDTKCKLVLDEGTINARSFDVIKLTSDSLVISRKEGTSLMYTQHYSK